MKTLIKMLIGIIFIVNVHGSAYTMEQPEALNKKDRDFLTKFLINYPNPSFIKTRTDRDLEKVIPLANDILDNPAELNNFTDDLKNTYAVLKKNKESIKKIFNELINKAIEELRERKLKAAQKKPSAPKLKPIPIKPKQPTPAGQTTLKKIVQAEINGDINYYKTRSNFTLETAINLINKTLNNKAELDELHKELPISKKELKAILERIRQKASIALKQAGNQTNKTLDEEAQKENLKPQSIMPAIIKNETLAEQPEEELRPNKLYIGLDVKELNSMGQSIHWQGPIDKIQFFPKIGDSKFEPNDYFHITIAWYESKNVITPEVIAKVERALAHAAEILKIVFPEGIHGISLLDGAVMLGNKNKNSIAFRVAESADLKKLQEIFLKFLSFEKIEGFKFSTFQKETPIHVTLGKIWPPKMGAQFKNIAAQLYAPEGARASQGQSFTINTYRLTYSVAGQAWQEKMSYKF